MKKYVFLGLAGCALLSANAQTFKEWQDESVNEVNRAAMHTHFFAYENAEKAGSDVKENSKNFMSMNGSWKFFWVKNAAQRPTDFCKVGYNDKGWNAMKVPAVWELNGYGDPIYVNIGYPWRNQYKNNRPHVPTEMNHVGS